MLFGKKYMRVASSIQEHGNMSPNSCSKPIAKVLVFYVVLVLCRIALGTTEK